jgi:hypothetical protein
MKFVRMKCRDRYELGNPNLLKKAIGCGDEAGRF